MKTFTNILNEVSPYELIKMINNPHQMRNTPIGVSSTPKDWGATSFNYKQFNWITEGYGSMILFI